MEIENLKLQKQIDELIDKIYPIGSFYDTTDTSFNPNEEWGGTWESIDNGTVLVSRGEMDSQPMVLVGGVIGSETVQLSRNNIPVHAHSLDNAYTKMYIGSNKIDYQRLATETFSTNVRSDKSNSSYYESINEYGNGIGLGGSTDFEILDPDPGSPEALIYPTPISVVQPSMVVQRWHRTA